MRSFIGSCSARCESAISICRHWNPPWNPRRFLMRHFRITEAAAVQFPMDKHAVEIGWTPLTPEEARVKRGGEDSMFLRDDLTRKLSEFNPWLSTDSVRSVIETLDALPATIEGNRQLLA